NGSFSFPALLDGSSYAVTVLTQPTELSQTCSVSNGSGTVSGSDVDTIEVNCITDTFTIGGTVSGLAGTGLVLVNNDEDELAVETDGSFTFPALPDGSSYEVSVLDHPSNPSQLCTVDNGQGVLEGNDVTDISINCADRPDALFRDRFQH
ncbi:MAG: hypothetical protein ACXIUM_09255, partial [Wenzhouxiangella sp.]